MSGIEERLGRAIGDRYAIERELGRGGMSIVYLALDRQHLRHVAIKVLAPEVARGIGADRFLREIEIAVRLNHPRIVPLLDSGTADGLPFYVMPYVEGETLRERLEREIQLPVAEAVEIARQVAAALSYAHGSGIVHRDVKPANILLTAGEAVVADFGIAQAVSLAGGAKLTESGIAVGTSAYMSPEQASGTAVVDARSDVYGLGCVLYEMLAGEPPFTGPTAQAVAARKLSESAPDVTVVRDTVPAAVSAALRKALAPLPADRFATAARFAEALTQATDPSLAVSVPARVRSAPGMRRVSGAAAVALLVLLAAWGWLRAWARDSSASADPRPVRLTVAFPSGIVREIGVSSLALSPDGRTLVVTGRVESAQQLFSRPLDRLDATPIEGTQGGQDPFFSPDGRWLGFYAEGRLRRVPAEGGAPIDIARLPRVPVGAAWTPDDRIIFAPDWQSPLYVVSARGGAATPLTQLDTASGEIAHVQPSILPDGRTLLFVTPGPSLTDPRIHALDLESGRRVSLIDGGYPRYAESGHLVLLRHNAVLAVPFDPVRLELGGTVASVESNVARFAVSTNGTMAYVPYSEGHDLVLVEPDGTERPVTDERTTFSNPQFSPDGSRIAVTVNRGTGDDIWIYDLGGGSPTRLTLAGGRAPVWAPDGRSITFVSQGRGVFSQPLAGTGEAELVHPVSAYHWLVGWTPDSILGIGIVDVGLLALEDGGEPHLVVAGGWGGRLSADGHWLAWYSFESGSFEVWVTRFPGGGARWQITTDGGRDPSWAPSGLDLYYRAGDRLVAATLDTTAGVRVQSRRIVLEDFVPPFYDDYDVHPDLRTLVMVRPVADRVPRDVVVVLDWFDELERATAR